MRKLHASLISLVTLVALSACGDRNAAPDLMNLRSDSRTPDEFAILPSAPLTQPESYADLPLPTPGGVNRTDRNPKADAMLALGGRPGAGSGADAGLISAISRYGVGENIRATLAAEDEQFRRENDGLLAERLFNVNVYYKAYAPQALDKYRELQRLRDAGIRTPAAPPDPVLLER